MRILLIEDDPEVARLIRLELAVSGWELSLASDGRQGLAAAVSGTFAAVVLDLSLPDVDGLSVLKAIREVSEVPVLVLTARGSLSDRVEGLDRGADDYLVKPFAAEELEARLRAIVRRSRSSQMDGQGVLELAGTEVDSARREAFFQGEALSLTRREFDLLRFFLENPGIVLTRDMILERVWGWGYAGNSNIVDVYVGNLRTKLQGKGAPPLIQTVRGVGYAFRPEGDPRA